MEPCAFERAKPFGPAGESRSGMKNTTEPQKSRSQSQNTDAEQVGVATTTGAAVIYARVRGCWKCAACLLCGRIQRDWITKYCALFYFIIYDLSLTTGSG